LLVSIWFSFVVSKSWFPHFVQKTFSGEAGVPHCIQYFVLVSVILSVHKALNTHKSAIAIANKPMIIIVSIAPMYIWVLAVWNSSLPECSANELSTFLKYSAIGIKLMVITTHISSTVCIGVANEFNLTIVIRAPAKKGIAQKIVPVRAFR
jgi:hypothetical protein